MIYVLSIDWLSIFCIHYQSGDWTPVEDGRFSFKKESFGTRCFSQFWRVRIANDEGGWDEFAEIQAKPYEGSVLPPYAISVRFCNRTLYMPDFWNIIDDFLVRNTLACESISRIDICADFNNFASIAPRALIEGFAAKKYRHIGRGVGALYFNHGLGAEFDESGHRIPDYGVQYTGLSFGTHASDAHCYLYNKTLELATQGDKPWIRDVWNNAGLDVKNVWRLEISIKSKGLKFKDKKSGMNIQVNAQMVMDNSALDKIYHTFVKRLFSFVRNHKGITNITREWQQSGLILFEGKPAWDRGTIRNSSPGNRAEKILIKNLYQFADKYRGHNIFEAEKQSQQLANCLAYATDLHDWLIDKMNEWERPIHK